MDLAWLVRMISAALSFIGGLAGAFFGGYLRKKGENLATHEDIAKLNEQMLTLATTTETIKGKISDASLLRPMNALCEVVSDSRQFYPEARDKDAERQSC